MNDYHPYDEDNDRQDHHAAINRSDEHDDDMRSTMTTVSTVVNQVRSTDGQSYRLNAADLHSLIDFMETVLRGSSLPYSYRRDGSVAVLKMADDIKRLPTYARIHDPSLSYSPDLEFFFEWYRQHEISNYAHVDWTDEDGHGVDPRNADMAIDFIATMLVETRRVKLKKRISDWKSNGKHNLAYLRRYLDNLFERYARLLFVDMVLEYRKTACADVAEAIERRDAMQGRADREHEAFMNGTEHHEENPRWISLVELKADWERLYGNMKGKRSIFKHLVGHVGRIEYSRDGGHHLHICFIFDGSEVQDHVGYSLKIAMYWKDVITEGRGYAFSCNLKAARGGYRNVGVGMIDHYDTEKRKHLWTALSYFAKATQLVRIKHAGKLKMFLHGKIKELTGPKRGRPRTRGVESSPGDSSEI
jgi:hypothetical protein